MIAITVQAVKKCAAVPAWYLVAIKMTMIENTVNPRGSWVWLGNTCCGVQV